MRTRHRHRSRELVRNKPVLSGTLPNTAHVFPDHAVHNCARRQSLAHTWDSGGSRCVTQTRENSAARAVRPLMIRQLAWSSLRRHTTRTILAILGVAVAAAMLLDM